MVTETQADGLALARAVPVISRPSSDRETCFGAVSALISRFLVRPEVLIVHPEALLALWAIEEI